MLLIDGVKYELWTPQSEDEFEQEVTKHTKEIFGEQSIFLDMKQRLKSVSGIGSVPDGFAILFGDLPHWHIVEVELSSHPLHDHIVSQVSRFISGIRNPSTQKKIVDAIYNEITGDDFLKLKVKQATQFIDIYKFLADLISQPPVLTIIIEKETQELREAISTLAHPQIKVVEFQTFVKEGIGLTVHAHLFEPLSAPLRFIKVKYEIAEYKIGKKVSPYHKLTFEKQDRSFLPGYKQRFVLQTDSDETQANVTSAEGKPVLGDAEAGRYITGSLGDWASKNGLKGGEIFLLEQVEPKMHYRLVKKDMKTAP